MVGKPIALDYLADWLLVLSLVGMAVLAGLVGGAYPALVLSGFRPARVLRTNAARQSGSGKVRTFLVVLQFAVSIGLGIAALVVFQQISFARAVELGFNKDRLVIVNGNGLPETARDSFLRALAANADIAGVAISDDVPFSGNRSSMAVQLPGASTVLTMRYVTISPEFLKVYDIHLLNGRDLSRSRGADVGSYDGKSFNVLLNATAAKQLGFSPAEALGKIVTRLPGPDRPQGRATLTVVGVVDDFKIDGAKTPVAPTAYLYVPSDVSDFSIKVRAANLPATLAFIDRTWHAFAPSVAIRRHFLNGDFENDFLAEQQQGKIFALFVGVAIFIAAMGLFGLAAFSTERRTKEIGIRKSFGARARDIVLMLLWQFSLPVLAANLIAWPVAYYYLHHWLEGYAYRISLNPLYFLGAGLAAMIIAWVTVFVHARRVANANPIHALRYE
jgi:putative ABC transport system permease protein